MKIGFVSLDHLRDWTGISRLVDRIAAEMAARGHEVAIIASEGKASKKTPVSALDYPHELITADVTTPAGRKQARERLKASGIDICAALIGGTRLAYMPALFSGSGIPYIVGESADPRVFVYERWHPYEHYGALYAADAVQVLLGEYIPLYPEPFKPRLTVIGNPAQPPSDVDFEARRSCETRTIIAVGRFNEEDKRYSLLLRAFASLAKDFPGWRLKLVGDGPFWEFYHIMAEQLCIKGLVNFTGAVSDTQTHYNTADIFCLPSFRAEGLPMVFGEAAAYALPFVGFDSCTASKALIAPDMGALAKYGEGGGEKDALASLADALRSLMALSPEARERLGVRAQDVFQDKYGGGKVFDEWERLFAKTLEDTRLAGKTQIGRIQSLKEIGKEWDGLTPDAPIWNDKILSGAALEIAAREDALTPTTAGDTEIENVRLRSELAQLKQEHAKLESKYASLLGRLQAPTNKKRKR